MGRSLLDRERRAALPLRRQLLLYLHPCALFEDASRGSAPTRAKALAYNRAMRWMLVAYLRRWTFLAGVLFLCIAPSEALAAQAALLAVPLAAVAIGFCIAVAVCFWIGAAYLLLGRE